MRYLRLLIILALVMALIPIKSIKAGEINGSIKSPKKKDLPNAVVYIDSVQGEFKPSAEHVVMDQKNLVFHPHVLPILAGTTVDFLNSDNVAHNVFSPDKSADKFNLGTWPTGEIRSYTFEKRCDDVCDAVMLCNVHPEMEAFVLIMQNPFFAKTDEEGKFTIKDVPAGKYTIKLWHPKKAADPVEVTVPEEGVVTIEMPLKKK